MRSCSVPRVIDRTCRRSEGHAAGAEQCSNPVDIPAQHAGSSNAGFFPEWPVKGNRAHLATQFELPAFFIRHYRTCVLRTLLTSDEFTRVSGQCTEQRATLQ